MATNPSIADKMRDFDPNDPRTGRNYMWATFVPSRRSSGFKMHLGRGPALNACNHEQNYILYAWDAHASRWREVARMERRRDKVVCEKCRSAVPAPTSYNNPLTWRWVGQPTLREVGLCRNCGGYGSPLYAMSRDPIDKRYFV